MPIGRSAAQDPMDEWIARIAPGHSFIDIGGIGELSTNERCTWALRTGAERVAMADLEPFDHALWQHWRDETRRLGIAGIEELERVNIDDPGLAERVGQWDIVHSTGILYHVPNPVHSLLNLRRTVRKWLIVNTVIVPDVVENGAGRLEVPASGVLFFAALGGRERAVMARHYAERFGMELDHLAPRREQPEAMMPYLRAGAPSYYPYWWIFTRHSFEAALELLEMRVEETHTWEDHAHFVLLRAE